MKKLITMFMLGGLVATNLLNAQTPIPTPPPPTIDSRNSIHFGAKVGANYSNVYDKQGDEYLANARIGFATGVFVAIPLGTYIGIQPEIQFSQKGFDASGRVGGDTNNFNRTSNYLDLPVLFALKPTESATFLVGPQFSYLLSQTDVYTSPFVNYTQTQEFKNSNIGENTLGLITGVDINIRHVVFGARMGWDLLNNDGDGTSSKLKYKNVWYQLTVGIRL